MYPYHIIRFQAAAPSSMTPNGPNPSQDQEWGFPLPHLLGMTLVCKAAVLTHSTDEITFYFDSGRIRVSGSYLQHLWSALDWNPDPKTPYLLVLKCGAIHGASITSIVFDPND